MGIEPCGFPRGGTLSRFVESIVATSHGSILGWRVKFVNQSQAPSESGSISISAAWRARRRSAFTAHLHGSELAQGLLGDRAAVGSALDPDTEVAVTEAGIVADGHRELRQPCIGEHADHRRE